VCFHPVRFIRPCPPPADLPPSLSFSDVPLTQFIISLNEQAPASEKFINHILDDTHLLVQPHKLEDIQQRVRTFQESNTYTAPAATADK
jgi:TFIIH basal transcription factor complex TTD-A subunit